MKHSKIANVEFEEGFVGRTRMVFEEKEKQPAFVDHWWDQIGASVRAMLEDVKEDC